MSHGASALSHCGSRVRHRGSTGPRSVTPRAPTAMAGRPGRTAACPASPGAQRPPPPSLGAGRPRPLRAVPGHRTGARPGELRRTQLRLASVPPPAAPASQAAVEQSATSRPTGGQGWEAFSAQVCGEWQGVTASFGPDGAPIELPEQYVPPTFREWDVHVFDWQASTKALCSLESTEAEAGS